MLLPPTLTAALQPVPVWLARRVAQAAFDRVLARHPRIFERLGPWAARSYCFAPSDLPFEFTVRPQDRSVRATRPGRSLRWDVRICGPTVLLLALAEGRVDGDAEFFRRQITIDGDMEAMLSLRNALENDAVDFVTDLAAATGPFRIPIERVLDRGRRVLLAREGRRWN